MPTFEYTVDAATLCLTLIPAPTPAAAVAKVLARTGSDASVVGGMAAMAAIAGIAALAGKRRRDRQEA